MNDKEFKKQLANLKSRVLDKNFEEDDLNYTESLFETIRHVNEY